MTLTRRLTALEQLAEHARYHDMREVIVSLEEARNLTPVEVDEAVSEANHIMDKTAQWKRAGLRPDEILHQLAVELNMPVDQLGPEARALAAG